jgi:hypothetical protein
MKVATVLLNEDRKLSPNEAICADKRAYSRAVLVYTDAVALLQHPGQLGDDAYCVRCAADLQNRKVRAEPARVRIRTEAAGPSREGAPRAGSLAFCARRPNRRRCDARMLVRRESGYLSTGQGVRGYIGMGQ